MGRLHLLFNYTNPDNGSSWNHRKDEVWFPGLPWQCLNWLYPLNSKLRFVWPLLSISSIIVAEVLFFSWITDFRTFLFWVTSMVILGSHTTLSIMSLTNPRKDSSCAKKGWHTPWMWGCTSMQTFLCVRTTQPLGALSLHIFPIR